jgi:MOSC domain-containing protein YiiM
MTDGTLRSINISSGGLPKLPRDVAHVTTSGIVGDTQRDVRLHGGPDRAICLYSLDVIEALQAEGHPIAIGAIGENLTISGLDWRLVVPDARLEVGEVVLQVTKPASPCTNLASSFRAGDITRVSQKVHPGWSRWYTRVLQEGQVSRGAPVKLHATP